MYHLAGGPLLASMTSPSTGDGGVPPTGSGVPAPFAVTAPPNLTLGKDRAGSTSFTITNLTGHPVKARLVPRGQNGAGDDWLSVIGPAEIPLAIASTVVAKIQVTVPADAPAGECTLHLQVVVEDDTERVTGQSVSFTVPPPVPEKKFRWLIVAIAAALVVVVGGGLALLALWDDDELVADPVGTPTSIIPTSAPTTPGPALPRNVQPPSTKGSPIVGKSLLASQGQWSDASKFSFQWVRCGTSSVRSCAAIGGATDKFYKPVVKDAGQLLRIRVSASSEVGTASAHSAPAGPVLAVAPAVKGLPIAAAIATAKKAGLKLQIPATVNKCPVVAKQSPQPGSAMPVTQPIKVTLSPLVVKC